MAGVTPDNIDYVAKSISEAVAIGQWHPTEVEGIKEFLHKL